MGGTKKEKEASEGEKKRKIPLEFLYARRSVIDEDGSNVLFRTR